MIRTLTIEEMLAMPERGEAVIADFNPYDLPVGTTLTRHHVQELDDEHSVTFYYQGHSFGFFGEGDVGVVESVILDIAPRFAEDTMPPKFSAEVGNPKVGAASKKYSLRYLPLSANIEVNRALENGADKYGLCNWRDTNVKASVYIDAALRHIMQWQEGQEDASDSTVHNLGHAMASLAIIIDAQAQGVLIDDRPTASKNTDALLLRSA